MFFLHDVPASLVAESAVESKARNPSLPVLLSFLAWTPQVESSRRIGNTQQWADGHLWVFGTCFRILSLPAGQSVSVASRSGKESAGCIRAYHLVEIQRLEVQGHRAKKIWNERKKSYMCDRDKPSDDRNEQDSPLEKNPGRGIKHELRLRSNRHTAWTFPNRKKYVWCSQIRWRALYKGGRVKIVSLYSFYATKNNVNNTKVVSIVNHQIQTC